MKKFCIIFLSLFILGIVMLGVANGGFLGIYSTMNGENYATKGNGVLNEREFLRIHIRADSNESEAQLVKYRVRDRVVEYLVPIIAECTSKEDALAKICAHLAEIEGVANKVLQEQGFSYNATATVEKEIFPTRVYAEYTLPSGEYTALILRLGRGTGDNWWCVAYPPLCFVNANVDVRYKSKLVEIIRRCKG